jgi:eukaryotic-like serine/threonine-protein kinase
MEVAGGLPITICDTADHRGGSWNRKDIIVFSPALRGAPLQKVHASGGVPAAATALEPGDGGHVRPVFLPDDVHFIYTATTGGVYIGSLESNDRALLFEQPSSSTVQYTDGHVLFMRETTLMAQPFDARRLTLVGAPFPVAEQIQVGGSPQVAVFSTSNEGVLTYQTGTAGNPQLTWFERTGKPLDAISDRGTYADIRISPDGKTATTSLTDPAQRSRDIWLVDLTRQGLRQRFTFDLAEDRASIWSRDGAAVVFNSNRHGHFDLYRKPVDLSSDEEPLIIDDADKIPLSWSRDGEVILYSKSVTSGSELWVLPLTGDRTPRLFLRNGFDSRRPIPGADFSPDGRWVAYASNESGTAHVFVTSFPVPGARTLISAAAGGSWPRWSADGREIFYKHVNGDLMAVALDTQGTRFQARAVTRLFNTGTQPGQHFYDIDPNGQRVLVSSPVDVKTSLPPITVVVNWLPQRTGT